MALEQRHLDFLTDVLGTDRVRHSGRNLLEHLLGTYDLLERWNAKPEVRLAGLFHSVYGTNAFKHRCLDLTRAPDRNLVKGLIGHYAETLVWIFCSVGRPRALWEAVAQKEPILHSLVTGEPILLTAPIVRDLLEIEAANLLEQGAREQTLWRMAASPGISEVARKALRRRLGEAA